MIRVIVYLELKLHSSSATHCLKDRFRLEKYKKKSILGGT